VAVKAASRLVRRNATATHKAIEHCFYLAGTVVWAAAIQVLAQRISAENPPTATMVQSFAALPKHLPRHDPPPIHEFHQIAAAAREFEEQESSQSRRKKFEKPKEALFQFHFRINAERCSLQGTQEKTLTTKDTNDEPKPIYSKTLFRKVWEIKGSRMLSKSPRRSSTYLAFPY
jgi:hypothetical protein